MTRADLTVDPAVKIISTHYNTLSSSSTVAAWTAMSRKSIDVKGLAGAMEVRVSNDHISWRTAAGEIGVSPSLLTRVRSGQRPNLEAFAAITRWLGRPADEFFLDPLQEADDAQPPLASSINALLRARRGPQRQGQAIPAADSASRARARSTPSAAPRGLVVSDAALWRLAKAARAEPNILSERSRRARTASRYVDQ